MAKIYPSQEKYQDNNPAKTFRMKKEEKQKIELMAETTGKSISQLLRENLLTANLKFEETYDEAYNDGFEEGYKEGKKEWSVHIPCSICGKDDLFLQPNSEWHKIIIDYLKQRNWGHKQCFEYKYF